MTSHQDHGGGICGPQTEIVKVNLQDVIRNRKEERRLKAEETRQSDLQRIRDMRSTIGIDPLERFPKELWRKIFDELDPKDRGNVWQIHPLFQDLLEKNRLRDILLPQVLMVIHTQFPHLLRREGRRNRFNDHLRLISKMSRNSFDRRVEDNLNRGVQENHSDASPYVFNMIRLNFNDELDERNVLQQLLTSFEVSSGKRFFPRELSVSLSEYDMEIEEENPMLMDQYKTDITTLLTRIGKQIWHFRFLLEDLESVTFSSSQVHALLQGWLSLMPNLKWVELLIEPTLQLIDENQGLIPFPHLPQLERLTFHSPYRHGNGSGTFQNIYGDILGANQRIKMLDLNYGIDWDDKKENLDLPHFPAHLIQSLQLERFTVCDEDYDSRNTSTYMVELQPIINCNWKLQTLVLSLTSKSYSDSMISVLQMLHHFPTLKKVKFNQLEQFTIGDTDKLGYLELSSLKEFHVEISCPRIDYKSNIHFFFSLQFLLRCKELKTISWQMNGLSALKLRDHLKKQESKNFGEMIDFGGGMKNLYYSNLWHVFPYLDTIDIEIRKEKEVYKDSCRHEYVRAEIENLTMRKFWKRHWCTQYKAPKACVL